MAETNITPEERSELLKLLRDTIAADKYPLSRRIRTQISARQTRPRATERLGAVPAGRGVGEQQHRAAEAPGAPLIGHGYPGAGQ